MNDFAAEQIEDDLFRVATTKVNVSGLEFHMTYNGFLLRRSKINGIFTERGADIAQGEHSPFSAISTNFRTPR